MSKKGSTDDYAVGYGKPPKNRQFEKGVSGNPTGRPKKPIDFDQQLLREARLSVVINENGRAMRITKGNVVIRQLWHKAMKGDSNAMKILFGYYQRAFEKDARLTTQRNSENDAQEDPRHLTDAQLERFAWGSIPHKE